MSFWANVSFVDAESVSRWVNRYAHEGIDTLLTKLPLSQLGTLLHEETLSGTEVSSRWPVCTIIALVQEGFSVSYSQRGMRKVLRDLNFSCQRGRLFYN